MQSRAHNSTQSTQNASAPVSTPLATRPFNLQAQTEPSAPQQEIGLNDQSEGDKPLGHNLANLRIFAPGTSPPEPPTPPIIQTKLTIGQPGDKYENEADRVAHSVINQINSGAFNRIQRQELQAQQELTDNIQLQETTNSQPVNVFAQRRASISEVAPGMTPSPFPTIQRQWQRYADREPQVSVEETIQRQQGKGQAIADNVRQPMEQAFGANFSGVRIHTDGQSDQLNQSLGARAFTTGQDIFFRQGAFNPGSTSGQELLAHELTHVVQQNSGVVQPKVRTKLADKENKVHNKASVAASIETGIQPKIQLKPNNKQQSQQSKQSPSNQAAAAPNKASATPAANTKAPQSKGGKDKATPAGKGETTANTKSLQPKGGKDAATPATKGGAKTSGKQGAAKGEVAAKGGAKAPASPQADPDFLAAVGNTKTVAEKEKEHEPATTEVTEAQAAAESPANEIESKAQANQVGEMEQAPTPEFDSAAFKEKLMQRISEVAPKTLEEAADFKKNNKLSSVKDGLSSQVKDEKKASQEPLEEKTKEAPDASGIEPKPVTPLPPTEPGEAPSDIGAEKAVPKPKDNSEVEAPLQENSQKLDQQMAEADITEEQLANSNEPQFQTALKSKQEAQTDASQSSQQYRQFEQGQLSQAETEATATAQQQLQGLHGDRTQILNQVAGQQVDTKGKDEQARSKVAGDIGQIYNETKSKVEQQLSDLDSQVAQKFDSGAAAAQQRFEDYVNRRMLMYKIQRYSGPLGPGLWVKDLVCDLPAEVNVFYEEGKQIYLKEMDTVIDQIVITVGNGLTAAKTEIANGKTRVQEYVAKLPQDLKTVGEEAASQIQSQFDSLEQTVNAKQDELINTLAQKYQEKLQVVDARIEEMKAANQGLLSQAANAINDTINTIKNLKEMLTGVLAKAAAAVSKIIKDPIGFLGNLVTGIKQGFQNFAANIGTHLQTGLITWLTGTCGAMGIQLPENIFSLPGIFSLVMQVLGLDWNYIRGKGVKLFGEPVVAAMEKGSELFPMLMKGDFVGMWEYVKESFGDLKEMVIEQIKEMVMTQVVSAGVKWIIGLLNPASAFVKAAMAIYDIVMFFVNRGSQIVELVNAVTEAISAIASGAVGGAAQLVENALASSLPVVIGFLASLLGVGDLATKVQGIVEKIRNRVDQAIDKVIGKVAKAFKAVGNKFSKTKLGQKVGAATKYAQDKYKAGKQWVDDKKEAAENWVNDKKESVENWVNDKKEAAANKFNNSKFGKKVGAATKYAKEKYEAGKQWVNDKKESVENWVNDKKNFAKDKFKQSNLGKKFDSAKAWGNEKKESASNWLKDKKSKIQDTYNNTLDKGKEKLAELAEWWKAKKKFKAKDGETHTLFFTGKDKAAKLTIASTPKPLDQYLKEIKKKNSKLSDDAVKLSNEKAIQSIELSADKIDKIKSGHVGKEASEEISQELESIARQLANIQELKEGVPPSQVKWTQKGEDGKSMIAEPLSIDPGGLTGSEPYEKSALWNKVSKRNSTQTTVYVRGHLLNHHVHGPGSKNNLTPITVDLNNNMERGIESDVKNKVLGEKKVVSYQVEVNYGGHSGRTNIPEEAQLATSLDLGLWEMKLKNGQDPKLPSSWQKNNKLRGLLLKHNLPDDLPVGKLPSIDFGNAPVSDVVKEISAVDGIGEKTAQEIGKRITESRKRGINEIEEKELLHSVPALGQTKINKLKKVKFS